MTRPEFDAWVEQHYGELLAVAVRRTDCEPEDIVQAAVAGMLASRVLKRIRLDNKDLDPTVLSVWPWAVYRIRSALSNRRQAGRRRARVKKETQAACLLGEKGNLRTPARRKCQ